MATLSQGEFDDEVFELSEVVLQLVDCDHDPAELRTVMDQLDAKLSRIKAHLAELESEEPT